MLRKKGYAENLKTLVTEQFRRIRTNIRFSCPDGEIKTITITSCNPGEGKSTVISNLALTIAQGGRRVAVVDCDLKKPSIHKKFMVPNDEGLTNILVGDKSIEKVINCIDKKNVDILTSGPIPPNSSELLSGKGIKEVLNELEQKYDMVLIDAPPVLYISDAIILSALSGGTIMVSAYGKTDKLQMQSAKESIEKAGGKILGVVINKVPKRYTREYGKYYSGI